MRQLIIGFTLLFVCTPNISAEERPALAPTLDWIGNNLSVVMVGQHYKFSYEGCKVSFGLFRAVSEHENLSTSEREYLVSFKVMSKYGGKGTEVYLPKSINLSSVTGTRLWNNNELLLLEGVSGAISFERSPALAPRMKKAFDNAISWCKENDLF